MLQKEMIHKEQNFRRMMGAFQMLKNLLTSQRSSSMKVGIGESTSLRKFNVSHNFVKTSKVWYPTTIKSSPTQVISNPLFCVNIVVKMDILYPLS